jgi:predicted nucleic acid-binding protein
MNDVAVDACCLINLLAANCVLPQPTAQKKKSPEPRRQSELPSLGLVLHVPTVVSKESLYILQPDRDEPTKLLKSPVDLEPHFAGGTLSRCEIAGDDETELFVGYASKLDDGEAACLALAKNRGWLLATDDRPATSLAGRDGVTVLTTAELLKKWATNTKASKIEAAAALMNVQRFAKFVPRRNSPEAAWWLSHFSSK